MYRSLGKETDDFKAFGNFWKFYQAYYDPEDTDEYWDKFIADGNKMIEMYPNLQIVRAFITAMQSIQEDKLKGQKK